MAQSGSGAQRIAMMRRIKLGLLSCKACQSIVVVIALAFQVILFYLSFDFYYGKVKVSSLENNIDTTPKTKH